MYLLKGNKNTTEIDPDGFDPLSRKMVYKGAEFIEKTYENLGEVVEVGAIYGSVARNEAKEGSDIDLVFICEDVEKYDEIAEPLDEIVKDFDEYEISPHLIRKSDLGRFKLLNYPPYMTKDKRDEEIFSEYYKNKK